MLRAPSCSGSHPSHIKVDLYHRFYTQLNYSKKTGKLKELFKSKTFSIEQIENNIPNRNEAKHQLEYWKSLFLIIQIFT